jgi:hypothetical protein
MLSNRCPICSVEECNAKAVANGLCQKHLMRLRRTGSVETVGKAGRPIDPVRLGMRRWVDGCSERTFAKYWAATRMLKEVVPHEEVLAAIQEATRPNGSVNYAKLERIAIRALMVAVVADEGKPGQRACIGEPNTQPFRKEECRPPRRGTASTDLISSQSAKISRRAKSYGAVGSGKI